MSALESIIVASCVGMSGNANDACQKALQAGSKQSGVEQNMNQTEVGVTKRADATAKEYLGEPTYDVVAGIAVVAKTVSDKSAIVALPTMGLCSSFKAEIKQDKQVLKLEWNF